MADRGRRGGKTIDSVHWTYGSFEFVGVAAGTAALTLFPAQHLPETLMRTRGEWVGVLSEVLAVNKGTSLTIGFILVPEGTGTTVLWSPVTDGDAPWLWWDTFNLVYEEPVADQVGITELAGGRRIIDSKAMRKVRNREVQVVIENASYAGYTASSVSALGAVRVLSGS